MSALFECLTVSATAWHTINSQYIICRILNLHQGSARRTTLVSVRHTKNVGMISCCYFGYFRIIDYFCLLTCLWRKHIVAFLLLANVKWLTEQGARRFGRCRLVSERAHTHTHTRFRVNSVHSSVCGRVLSSLTAAVTCTHAADGQN